MKELVFGSESFEWRSAKRLSVHRVGGMILSKMAEKTDVLWDVRVTLVAISLSEEGLCEQLIESL